MIDEIIKGLIERSKKHHAAKEAAKEAAIKVEKENRKKQGIKFRNMRVDAEAAEIWKNTFAIAMAEGLPNDVVLHRANNAADLYKDTFSTKI